MQQCSEYVYGSNVGKYNVGPVHRSKPTVLNRLNNIHRSHEGIHINQALKDAQSIQPQNVNSQVYLYVFITCQGESLLLVDEQ